MRTTTIGIDPGASGALAALIDGKPVIYKFKEDDPCECITDVIGMTEDHAAGVVAYVEEVGGYVGKPQPGSAMFKFGRSFGYVLGLLRGMNVRTVLVRPQTWQKGLSGMASLKGPDRKRALRDEAARRFPGVKVTLDNCDALLIAEYGQRQEMGGAK